MRIQPRSPRTAILKTKENFKMGRPLNKRYFGSTADGTEIEVSYWDGAPTVGYIVKQMGSKKFRVTTDGVNTFVCFLKDDGAPAVDGDMTITVTDDAGTPQLVSKIAAHKVTLATGEVVGWTFTANVADDDRGTIEESAGFVSGDPISVVDAVNGTLYIIVEPGDTVFTGFGAADSNAGTTFTMANSPGTGTGTVAEYTA